MWHIENRKFILLGPQGFHTYKIGNEYVSQVR